MKLMGLKQHYVEIDIFGNLAHNVLKYFVVVRFEQITTLYLCESGLYNNLIEVTVSAKPSLNNIKSCTGKRKMSYNIY